MPQKQQSDTPISDRIEREEVARLAEEFRATAKRWYQSADVFQIAGRPTLAVKHRARAWVYEQAARCCQDQLKQEDGE
jgi:hypothetical protein